MACVATSALLLGAVWDPSRIWANLLVASYGLLGIGLSAAVCLALFFVTGARWSDRIRPMAERLTRLLPAGAIGVAIVLIAAPSLYPWTHGADESASPFQAVWLWRPFFLLRAVIFLGVWLGLVYLLVRASRRQRSQPQTENRPIGMAAGFLVVFALTCWLASTDWIMSLEP